ncbi:MAG: dinucleotide-binding protein [bacterium]|nr:dinucleotide-binding protein [bacterium]
MRTRVGIIGDGNVGRALESDFRRAGGDVRSAGKEGLTVRSLGAWAQVIVLAVAPPALDAALAVLGRTVDGKLVVDATDLLTPHLVVGFTSTGAHILQQRLPRARVVKAFNTVEGIAAELDALRSIGNLA